MTVHAIKPRTQADADVDHSAKRTFDFDKPLFNTETAAAYVDKPSAEAFRKWAKRQGIAVGHCGRLVLVARRDLDVATGFAHRHKRKA